QARVLLLELVAHRPHRPEDQPEEQGVREEEQVDGMVGDRLRHRPAGKPEMEVYGEADDRNWNSPEESEPQVVILQRVVREALAEGLQVRGNRLVEHGLPKCKPD